MRKAFSDQRRLDCRGVLGVELNFDCRDEIVPILRAIQHVYEQPKLRKQILDSIAEDVNRVASPDLGRKGMDYWQILVLAALRLGCDLNYDKLQDLAENHGALRHIMGIGDWSDKKEDFDWRRIQDNVCLLKPATIEMINHAIVAEGHRLDPTAAEQVRADFFVVETNIHWPSESSLIRDGVRKIVELCVLIDSVLHVGGWRQAKHLLKQIKKLARNIDRIASRKGMGYQERLKREYALLLEQSGTITQRAERLLLAAERSKQPALTAQAAQLRGFLERTEQVRKTARRRVLNGETVPNVEKLFSIFEPHTQLYKRGKAREPVQYGRMALVYEDGAGFITHSYLLGRDELERDVIIPQTRILKKRLKGMLRGVSFDRGCHSPENQQRLAALVDEPCLPMPGAKQAAAQEREATTSFRQARQRHPGIESAIGALQSGNGLERCRDRTEVGLARYLALGVLGRNLHVLGKLLIAREAGMSEAARSKRKHRAA